MVGGTSYCRGKLGWRAGAGEARGERVGSAPILATTEASSGGVPVLERRGERVWVVHRSLLPPRQARWGAGAGEASNRGWVARMAL
jgi:hypothetical protein